MPQYFCPLCKQEVSRVLYEKITGVWKEKESRLADLKEKEIQLLKKEREMQARFAADKNIIIRIEKKRFFAELAKKENMWEKKLKKEREFLRKKRKATEELFKKRLVIETRRIMIQERNKAKDHERTLKLRFESNAKKLLDKEKRGLLRQKGDLQKQEKIQMNRYRRLNQQYISLQAKSGMALERANKKIGTLEEQVRKNQTPQVLGLLEEGIFLEKLKAAFPFDRFEHTGKGGDIIHRIIDKNAEIGIIVYELKKVGIFNKNHIVQALEAKKMRNADYGILITNAKRFKDDFGFSVAKGVIIIHPAGALVLIDIIRDHLIRIAKLKLSAEKRRKTVQAVLEYIQGPNFRNGVEAIIEDTKELYLNLTKEVNDHIKSWEFRYSKYRDIHGGAHIINKRVVKLLEGFRKDIDK